MSRDWLSIPVEKWANKASIWPGDRRDFFVNYLEVYFVGDIASQQNKEFPRKERANPANTGRASPRGKQRIFRQVSRSKTALEL